MNKLPRGTLGLIFTLLGWFCFAALSFYFLFRLRMMFHHHH